MRYALLLGWLAVATAGWNSGYLRLPHLLTVPTLAPPPELMPSHVLLGSLEPGELLRLEYRSTGCFHDVRANVEFRRLPAGAIEATVTLENRDTLVPPTVTRVLTASEVQRLDNTLEWYGLTDNPGGCTTQTRLRFRRYRGSVLVARLAIDDDHCMFGMDEGYLPFWALVNEVESARR